VMLLEAGRYSGIVQIWSNLVRLVPEML